MSTISSFESIESKHDVCRGKDCIKRFSKSLREHAIKIKFKSRYVKDKKYCKGRDHCYYKGEYRGAVYSICNSKYSVPKKFLYVFIELAKELGKICLFRRKH